MSSFRNLELFAESVLHDKYRFFGRRLKPFSLYHRFWLEALGCSLVGGNSETAGLLDFEMASRICASAAGLPQQRPSLLRKKSASLWSKYSFWRRCRMFDLDYQTRIFLSYLDDYSSLPEVKLKGGEEEKESGVPDVIWWVSGLMTLYGMDERKAWAMSPSEANWKIMGAFIAQGKGVEFKTDLEIEVRDNFERELEQIERLRSQMQREGHFKAGDADAVREFLAREQEQEQEQGQKQEQEQKEGQKKDFERNDKGAQGKVDLTNRGKHG